ncbi:hypothetical protein [Streptomyces sp. NBC_00258]|uniref:hypothetical protein n=1 Tax=Streptomyces sp. NBC_00258 TaxID=2903642 RepID=UPI002E2E186F|nr:hypothetical protein [Streptomyces sp. NBC_00258]
MGLLLVAAGQGLATESSARTGFSAQARAAGLSTQQATALQAKVDDYLVTLAGRGTQISPNQIDMNGAMLNVTVPGETHPRQLVQAAKVKYQADGCHWPTGGAPSPPGYGWFCAYERESLQGDTVSMYHCDNYEIPFRTIGGWWNNQTTGTKPVLYWENFQAPPWGMPAAPSRVTQGVKWDPVHSIKNCV